MIAILGYGALALLCVIVLVALLMWWDFCVWRQNGDRLSRSHWLTDGDCPTCDERTEEPITDDDNVTHLVASPKHGKRAVVAAMQRAGTVLDNGEGAL